MHADDLEMSEIIGSEAELRSLIGYSSDLVQHKVIANVDTHCRAFIAKSPFLIISTSDASGRCDASPRGDHPGFVHVMDDRHLIIPERPGNKRIDSLRNIITNPQIGLLFIIPGLGETLRVNGRAFVTKDEKLLRPMAVNDRPPIVGILVKAAECFLHCAKAFLRSKLWNPGSWPATVPSASKILSEHAKLSGMTAETIAARLEDGYTNRLY